MHRIPPHSTCAFHLELFYFFEALKGGAQREQRMNHPNVVTMPTRRTEN